jgi:predicted MFS family arabinose efflux permease
VPLFTDGGLTPAAAAGLASLTGLAVIVGRVAAGFLVDRFWAPGVAFAFLAAPAFACLILAQPVLPPPALLGVAALTIGLAAGAEFDLIAFLVSRYFGMRHYGVIYSVQMVAMLLAGGIAPPVFGRAFDATGSYSALLWPCAIVFVAAPLLLLTLGRYPDSRAWRPAPA